MWATIKKKKKQRALHACTRGKLNRGRGLINGKVSIHKTPFSINPCALFRLTDKTIDQRLLTENFLQYKHVFPGKNNRLIHCAPNTFTASITLRAPRRKTLARFLRCRRSRADILENVIYCYRLESGLQRRLFVSPRRPVGFGYFTWDAQKWPVHNSFARVQTVKTVFLVQRTKKFRRVQNCDEHKRTEIVVCKKKKKFT